MADRRAGALVLVNGRGYSTEPSAISWQTVPVGRQGVDQGAGPGETALSNEIIWRRSRDDWIEGAGQDNADLLDDESSRLRFADSQGVDPWTRRQLTLLHSMDDPPGPSGSNLKLVVASASGTSYVVAISAGTVQKSSHAQLASWSTLTGGAGTYTDITTDGTRVWVCNGSDVYRADAGAAALTLFSTEDTDRVAYANGRLVGTNDAELFELSNVGVKTTIFTHPSSAFVWDGIAGAPGGIYAFGHLGDKTEVYVTVVDPTTGALDVPTFACSLPDGELLNVMCFYIGVVILGTSEGVRLATADGSGFLTFGSVITAPGDVKCLEPQGEDVWFGWSDMPGSYSGLGRLHLSRFLEPLVPAYASDLRANEGATGTVQSVVTFGGKRVFAIASDGVWIEEPGRYPTAIADSTVGVITLGDFTFGIPEYKTPDSVTIWTDPLPATCAVIVDVTIAETGVSLGSFTFDTDGATTATYQLDQTATERIRVALTLSTETVTSTPTVRRVTLRAVPSPFVAQKITVPLFIADSTAGDRGGTDFGMDPFTEWDALETLLTTRERFTLQVGAWTGDVRMEALGVQPGGLGGGNGWESWDDRGRWFNGRVDATMTTVQPETA